MKTKRKPKSKAKPKKAKHSLTDKQQAFCREYVIDWNATQAAIRAGYTTENSRMAAYQLLTNIYIQDEIDIRKKAIGKKYGIQEESIITALQKIAEFNPENYVDDDSAFDIKRMKKDGYDGVIAEANRVENKWGVHIKLKFHSKEKALELLGRYKAMWVDKTQHEAGQSFIDWMNKFNSKNDDNS